MRHYSGKDIFSSKVICGECGGFYGPKVWHSTDKYRRVIWQCNRKFKRGEERCGTPHLTEEEIKAAIISAENKRIDETAEGVYSGILGSPGAEGYGVRSEGYPGGVHRREDREGIRKACIYRLVSAGLLFISFLPSA